MGKSLYHEDIVLWSVEQAHALREAGVAQLNLPSPIDWENVAEEIESLGRSERSALRSHIGVIIEHLMKLEVSPAQDPRRGWIDTVLRERRKIEDVLDDSPSLRREVPDILVAAISRQRRLVLRLLALYEEQPLTALDDLNYTEEQVLGDWLPADRRRS
jgi:Domain of unknown function DUF29